MKKILYFAFFISLFFLINVDVDAATGYCEYSLTKFSENNNMVSFESQDDVTITFKVDTNKKNDVTVQWNNSNYDILEESDSLYQIRDNNYNIVNFKLNFKASSLYDKLIKNNVFSCPKMYGYYSINNRTLTISDNSNVSGISGSLVGLKKIDEQKPENSEQETVKKLCGVGNLDDKLGLPENMTIEFRKKNNGNEVCVNYYMGGNFCEPYISGQQINIRTEIASKKYSFLFESSDLKNVFDTMNSNTDSCPNFWVDSINSDLGTFKITTKKPENGTGVEMTTEDFEEAQKNQQFMNGTRFKDLLGQLKGPLSYFDASALNIKINIDGNSNATLNNNITTNYELCDGDTSVCSENARYLTERGLMNVREYCNEIYSAYSENKNASDMQLRMDECLSFDEFYEQLVNNGLIEDLANGCDIITGDLAEKLNYFLDIIKIAGPLIALGLGTVDFIKVIANGDADKEMKNAFKKFMIRLGAAALLFIIPIIIAFLLDIFMKPDSGYEADNPFCNVIDWNE